MTSWKESDDHVAIIGVGAIGGYFGARLINAGVAVTLVDSWSENVVRIRREGLRIEAIAPGHGVSVRPDIRDIGEVQSLVRERPIDILFVAMKSYDTTWATQLMLPYLAADGVVVSLQNGLNEPAIASIVGAERTYGCAIVSLACDMVEPGLVKRMSPAGSVVVGPVAGGKKSDAIAAVLANAETSRVTDNLLGIKWSKLVINAMRNGLSAMTGMTGIERDTHPVTRKLGIILGAQAVQTGRAAGYELEDTGYVFDTLVAAAFGDVAATAEIHQTMHTIATARSGEQRPSMAQDIRKGRRTETDAINGFVAEIGHLHGVDTKAHVKVHQVLLEIERGRLQPWLDLAEKVLEEL